MRIQILSTNICITEADCNYFSITEVWFEKWSAWLCIAVLLECVWTNHITLLLTVLCSASENLMTLYFSICVEISLYVHYWPDLQWWIIIQVLCTPVHCHIFFSLEITQNIVAEIKGKTYCIMLYNHNTTALNLDFLWLQSCAQIWGTFRIQILNMADLAAQFGPFSRVSSRQHLDKRESFPTVMGLAGRRGRLNRNNEGSVLIWVCPIWSHSLQL